MSLFEIKIPHNVRIDVHVHQVSNEDIKKILDFLIVNNQNQTTIMQTQAELAAQLNSIATALTDVGTEVTKVGEETKALQQKIIDLQAVIDSQGGVSPELQAAADAVAAQAGVIATAVKTLDDLVPDAPTTEPTV